MYTKPRLICFGSALRLTLGIPDGSTESVNLRE
jgi:hypothetical protein